jgi:hypothetical protein
LSDKTSFKNCSGIALAAFTIYFYLPYFVNKK